jgi:hypothetical protein
MNFPERRLISADFSQASPEVPSMRALSMHFPRLFPTEHIHDAPASRCCAPNNRGAIAYAPSPATAFGVKKLFILIRVFYFIPTERIAHWIL